MRRRILWCLCWLIGFLVILAGAGAQSTWSLFGGLAILIMTATVLHGAWED